MGQFVKSCKGEFMDIVIVGDGKVGFTLASQLDHEGHNGATRETLLRAKANLAEAIMIEHKVVERESVDQILAFFGAWMVIIVLGAMIVSLGDFDFETTLSSVYPCLGNVGPGLGLCGPASSFTFFSPLMKITLSFCMLLGRLEIYPILIFLLPIMTLTQKKKVKIGKVDYN